MKGGGSEGESKVAKMLTRGPWGNILRTYTYGIRLKSDEGAKR